MGGAPTGDEFECALFTAYQKYEADLRQAGVLLAGDPLQPTERASRIIWRW